MDKGKGEGNGIVVRTAFSWMDSRVAKGDRL